MNLRDLRRLYDGLSAQSMTSTFSMTSQSMASLKYGKHIEKLNPPVWAIHVELMIVIYAYKVNKVARLEVFLWDTGCVGIE